MMKTYTVDYTKEATRSLKKMDPSARELILNWIGKNLKGCVNPRTHGKGLTGNHSGEWRYRIGSYRVIADIQDDKVLILILTAGHRKDVYL